MVGAKALRQGSKDVLAERCICLAFGRDEEGTRVGRAEERGSACTVPQSMGYQWFSSHQTAFWPVLSREPYALTDLKRIPLEA